MSERLAIGEMYKVACPTCGGLAYEQGFGHDGTPTLFSGVCVNKPNPCGGWIDKQASKRMEEAVS